MWKAGNGRENRIGRGRSARGLLPVLRRWALACTVRVRPMQPTDDTPDLFDLSRFVAAQEGIYADAIEELESGRKRSHWMWYIFPQVAGLGRSAMAQRYAIHSKAEAVAYLAHSLLGPRLRRAAEALLTVQGRTAMEIMGPPDDLKLRSSMTLFAHCSPPGSVFHRVLDRYFAGEPDGRTVESVRGWE